MGILALTADERVTGVKFTKDTVGVSLRDGRTIIVPLAWYPRLLNASVAERNNWQVAGGGYGIHWPELDEDLSTEGLLRGAPAPRPPRSGRYCKQHEMKDKVSDPTFAALTCAGSGRVARARQFVVPRRSDDGE
jgi:hypothetical protein